MTDLLAGVIDKLASLSELQAPSLNFTLIKVMYADIASLVSKIAPVQKPLDRLSVLRQGEAPLQLHASRARTLGGELKQFRTCTWCLEGS